MIQALPVVDDLPGPLALCVGQRQLLDDACGGSDASLPSHDDERVALHRVFWDAPAV
jgi:hypothetical protein